MLVWRVLIWFGLNGCKVFKQEIVEIVVGVLCAIVVGLVVGAWCLVLGSIPLHSISVRSGGACFLAGWCSRRQGEDQWCVFGFEDVGWRCVLCWCFRALVLSFFPLLLLLPRGSILVLSEVCVRGSSTRFAGVM